MTTIRDLDIKHAKAGDGKALRLNCGDGLYCVVTPKGNKTFKTEYWHNKRHVEWTFGHYPAMSLAKARAARMALRELTSKGIDPRAGRQAQAAERMTADAATVRAIAERWIKVAASGWSPGYKRHVELRMGKYILPKLGETPIALVSTLTIESLLHDIAAEYRAQAVHVRQHLQCLFDYAIGHELLAVNPVRKLKYLPTRVRGDAAEQHQPHVTTIEAAREVLAAVEGSTCNPFLKLAHRLIALTAVRKMEAMGAAWSEITEGADGMTWTIPAGRMKGRRGQKRAHVIPLAPQAADVFRAARKLAQDLGINSEIVFPGRGEAGNLERSSLNEAMARVGLTGKHSVHGWRTTFSTLLNEQDPGAYRVIDVMLAHKTLGAVEAHYNKAQYLAERRRMAGVWADQLLEGAPAALAVAGLEVAANSNVIELRRAA